MEKPSPKVGPEMMERVLDIRKTNQTRGMKKLTDWKPTLEEKEKEGKRRIS